MTEIKLCINCEYCFDPLGGIPWCIHHNLLGGDPIHPRKNCAAQRSYGFIRTFIIGDVCGKRGKWFEMRRGDL